MRQKTGKILSILLVLMIILSTFVYVSSADVQEIPTNYYVGYNASGYSGANGLTAETRFASVAQAVDAAISAGATKDTPITIHIVQAADPDVALEAVKAPPHKFAYLGSLPVFDIPVTITADPNNSYNDSKIKQPLLFNGTKIGTSSRFEIKGPITFDNVQVVYNNSNAKSATTQSAINFHGNNITFTEKASFGYINKTADAVCAATDTISTLLTPYPHLPTSIGTKNEVYTKPLKITFANNMDGDAWSRIDIPEKESGTYSFKDVTLEFVGFNNGTSIRFGGDSNAQTNTIDGNLNLKLTPTGVSGKMRFFKGKSNVKINGAVQIIDNGITFCYENSTASSYSNFFSKMTTLKDAYGTDAPEVWYLKVTGNSQSIDFINGAENKGKFQIAEGFKAVATNVEDSNIVVNSDDNGLLDLSAKSGEYTINFIRTSNFVQKEYFVKADGTGDGKTEGNPAATISEAVSQAIADGLLEGDEATVKVIGTERVLFGTMPNHPFKLIITSNTEKEATVGSGKGDKLGGDTEFKNIKIFFGGTISEGPDKNTYHILACNGHNVTFGDGTVYSGNPTTSTFCIATSKGSTVFNNDFTVKSQIAIRNYYLGGDYGSPVFNGNVNIEYNCATQAPVFRIGTGNGSSTFNKALNLNIKNATQISFREAQKVAFGTDGYMQIMNSSATEVIPADVKLTAVPEDKLWVINNVSGKNNLLEFTDTKGKYKVNLDNPEHQVMAKNIATKAEILYDGVSEYMTLEPGVYELRILRDPKYKYYYVDSAKGVTVEQGTRPTGVGTAKKPVKTIADASRLIAEDGLVDIDVATIYLLGGEETEWGTAHSSLKCTVVMKSTNSTPATVKTNPTGGATLFADTVLNNIEFTLVYQYGEFVLNEYDFTLDEESSLSAAKTYLWATARGKKRTKDMNIVIKGTFKSSAIHFYAAYHDHTSTANYNIVWDSADSPCAIDFGNEGSGRKAEGKNIYEGDIKLTVKNADSCSISTKGLGADLNGSLSIIVDGKIVLPYNTKKTFNELEVKGGKWYVTNGAEDSDFVSFSDQKGKFSIKNGKTAYSRMGKKAVVKHKGGTVDLSKASGSYVISDNKKIDPVVDNPNKMLYYRVSGGSNHIAQRALLMEKETYVYEYTLFSHSYELCKPIVVSDNRYSVLGNEPITIISDKKVGNFHKVVCEFTIPDGVTKGKEKLLFVGIKMPAHDEGIILDRTVYNKKDKTKTDLFDGDNKFHDGLDNITLNYNFWGKTYKGEKGGTGKSYWTDGIRELKVMDKDLSYSDILIYLNNPQDGKWWNDEDLKVDGENSTAKAIGTFKDQDGNGIKGVEFNLISEEDTYKSITDAKGRFSFNKIIPGFYDLYIINGSEKINLGFTSFVAGDFVEYSITSDTSGLSVEENITNDNQNDGLGDSEIDNTEEITPSGNLRGTVYTPNLEVVPELKIIIKGTDFEAVTDNNGSFGFADIPVGEYELCAINSDGSEYVFRTVNIKQSINLDVKLKYDSSLAGSSDAADNGWIIWVIIASVVALAVVVGLVVFLVIKKKKTDLI